MGIDLSALVRGASKGLAAYQEGKTEAERYREQALARLFAQKLQERQQQEMERRNKALEVVQAQPRYQIITDPMTGEATAVDPRTLATRPVGAVRGPRPPDMQIFLDPNTGKGMAINKDTFETRDLGALRSPKPEGASVTTIQEVRAAAGSLMDAARTAAELEGRDPLAGTMPMTAAGARGLGKLPIIGGALSGFSEGAAQSLMSPAQQQFRQAADLFTHNYVATLPKARVSPQLIAMINETFFARPGQTDPEVLQQFREKRNDAATRLWQATQGQSVDLSGLPGLEGLSIEDLTSGASAPRPRTPGLGQTVTPTPPGARPLPKPRRLGDLESKYGIKP